MYKAKKFISYMALCVLIFSLCACGEKGSENAAIYGETVGGLEDNELFAIIDTNASLPVLLVTSQVYNDGLGNQAALNCDVYYLIDKEVKNIGTIESMGTAYPIAYDETGIYAASGHDMQRFEIEKFCADKKYAVESWIEETISGTKRIEERRLGKLLRKMVKNDILVVTELSRLGRNLMQIMSILHFCMEKNIMVMTTKEHYELGNNINSQVLAFAFGLSAQIERNLISARTKEALARKKAEGVILGRPKGRKSIKVKLTGKENIIQMMLAKDLSKSKIARKLRVHRATLTKFIIERLS